MYINIVGWSKSLWSLGSYMLVAHLKNQWIHPRKGFIDSLFWCTIITGWSWFTATNIILFNNGNPLRIMVWLLSLYYMYHVQLTVQLLVFSQAETEVVVKSGNVNVVDKMIVSGYDVKVGQNSICWLVTFIYCTPFLQSAYPTHLFPLRSHNIT